MPSELEHLTQAAHNEEFSAAVDRAKYADWAVTGLFYAALHYVDAYLAKKHNEHPGIHEERDRLIRSHATTGSIRPHYRRLLDRSHAARYRCASFSVAEIESLQTNDLDPIKKTLS